MANAKLSHFLGALSRAMAAETLRHQSDRELLEQFLARKDEAVFEALVRRHGPMVYRVCWRVLRHSQNSEDAFQATFFLLAQKLRTLRNRDSLASWLHGVAHRVALKAKAQAATRGQHERQAGTSVAVLPDEATWGNRDSADIDRRGSDDRRRGVAATGDVCWSGTRGASRGT